jgi:hypothetical protein
LDYVTAPAMARYNIAPGAPIVASAPAEARDAKVELVTPRGRSISLSPMDAEAAPTYRYSQTSLPGTYRMLFTGGGGPAGEVPFQVARDGTESELRPLSDDERGKLLAAGLQFDGEAIVSTDEPEATPRREPFWGLLLTSLVLLLAGELLLSGGLARQRHGLAVSAH